MKYLYPCCLLVYILFSFIACSGNKSENGNGSQFEPEYLIAYNVLVNPEADDYDILTMNLDGSDKKNITNNPDVAWTYHSAGDKIFFISDRDTAKRYYYLYEMNSDGSELKKISNFRLKDSWMGSRDNGNEIVVSPHPSVDSLLYRINRKGDLLQKVSTGTLYSSDPSFSPDGKKIAFVGSNKKSKREPGFKAEIYTVNPDGTDLKQLTSYPDSDTTAEWFAYKAGPPMWHPTENFISYQSKQNGKYSLYAVMSDGSKQWKLTNNSHEEGWHSWSPDGNWLAIELFDEGQSQFHIGLMNWNTKQMNILTDTTYKFQQAPNFVAKVKK